MAQALSRQQSERSVRYAARRQTREGSPWAGLWTVVAKEMADHLSSVRMVILEVLIVLVAVGTVYVSTQAIQNRISQDDFLYLRLMTTANSPLPSFISLLAFFIPLLAIALGFDAVNGEFNRRTMSRLLAQPIYRDALLMGKFLGGLFTLALVCTSIWLLILGMGVFILGVQPGTEEVGRSLWFLLATIFYGGIWLALALVFSVIFRQPATAALASIAIWLFYIVFWNMIAGVLAQALSPIQFGFPSEILAQANMQLTLSRLSPNTLYAEAMVALLQPEVRSLGIILPSQMDGAILGSPLPLMQSVLLIWPQLTGLIAGTILLFALAYVLFQRQEIRA
ncbi:MAG: ABC transporter permease [Chloroflexi bacterium]|mgnify:CR=1 FL=1|jgi:ABC-2 type transport system permease protein|nr:ABC transporter permease [Chloroflexota bacterium]